MRYETVREETASSLRWTNHPLDVCGVWRGEEMGARERGKGDNEEREAFVRANFGDEANL